MAQDKQGTSFRFQEVLGTTPVVLIHGVGLDQGIWDSMLGDITSHSTLTYDLLGHGETVPPLGAQSFQPFVAQLHSLLQQLEITELVLVGFSLGGQVAKHFASAHPDLVKALVLISTTYRRTPEERATMALRVQQAKAGDQTGLESSALQRWFNPEYLAANPAIESRITARLRNNDPARFLESYELLSNAEDHVVDYSALEMPVLILTGDGDPGSTPRMAEEMAQAMPDARAEIIVGAKHLGIIERHRQFSDAVLGFLAKNRV